MFFPPARNLGSYCVEARAYSSVELESQHTLPGTTSLSPTRTYSPGVVVVTEVARLLLEDQLLQSRRRRAVLERDANVATALVWSWQQPLHHWAASRLVDTWLLFLRCLSDVLDDLTTAVKEDLIVPVAKSHFWDSQRMKVWCVVFA